MRALRNGCQEHSEDVERGDYRRHSDWIAAYPGHGPIIIGGSDSEHGPTKQLPTGACKVHRLPQKVSAMPVRPGPHTGQKKFLENGANRKKLILRSNQDRQQMKNAPSAISPPKGIGDRPPQNQAVLDWVH